MKKRLRKKRRIGEFREDCFELTFEMSAALTDDEVNSLTDTFIGMIESNGLQFGGGGNCLWTGIVQGPCRGSATEADRRTVIDWLFQHQDVLNAQAGPLRDAWYVWSS